MAALPDLGTEAPLASTGLLAGPPWPGPGPPSFPAPPCGARMVLADNLLGFQLSTQTVTTAVVATVAPLPSSSSECRWSPSMDTIEEPPSPAALPSRGYRKPSNLAVSTAKSARQPFSTDAPQPHVRLGMILASGVSDANNDGPAASETSSTGAPRPSNQSALRVLDGNALPTRPSPAQPQVSTTSSPGSKACCRLEMRCCVLQPDCSSGPTRYEFLSILLVLMNVAAAFRLFSVRVIRSDSSLQNLVFNCVLHMIHSPLLFPLAPVAKLSATSDCSNC